MNMLKAFKNLGHRLFPRFTDAEMQRAARTAESSLAQYYGDTERCLHDLVLLSSTALKGEDRLRFVVAATLVAVAHEYHSDVEPEPELKIKRCLTCSGYFDTAGDYCPSCASSAEEDEGILDLDLFPLD